METAEARASRFGGRLPLDDVLAMADGLLDVLAAAHASGDLRLEGVELVGNARAAAVFDKSSGAIIIVGGRVEAGVSQLKVVVQNAVPDAHVEIPADLVSVVQTPLAVSAPEVPLARILP